MNLEDTKNQPQKGTLTQCMLFAEQNAKEPAQVQLTTLRVSLTRSLCSSLTKQGRKLTK